MSVESTSKVPSATSGRMPAPATALAAVGHSSGQHVSEVAPELAVAAGDQDPKGTVHRATGGGSGQAPSTTGARSTSGSHQFRWSRYQPTVSARPRSKATDGSQPSCAADLGGVEEVAAVVAGPVGNDLLQRRGLAGRREHRVGDLLDARLDAAADVVGLADRPRAAAPARWPGSGRRRAATRAGSGSTRRAAAAGRRAPCAVNNGITFSGNW